MKLAISGKGGTGKTTLAGVLAWVYANEGRKVLAVDADPDANLASALGFVLLKSLLRHLLLERDEVVIVDMEAGIEHLGR
nr:AAA family ATPase [Candidatus Hakubella thermalkaliphila]